MYRNLTQEAKTKIVLHYKKSGLCIDDYVKETGVPEKDLTKWVYDYETLGDITYKPIKRFS